MRKISLIGSLLVFMILFSPNILAQNKTKAQIKLPVFMAGKDQVVDKPVDGDLMMAGDQIKIVANIAGDAYVGGGQVDVGGTINGNLIVAGGNVTITGKVNKNLIVVGGQVRIDNSAEIGGYVLAGGGEVSLLGKFSGPVKVGTGSLVVGEKAFISGNLEADVTKSEVATTAKIMGEKKIQVHETKAPEEKPQVNQWRQLGYVKEIFSFLSKLVILLIVVKLGGKKIKGIETMDSFWSMIGLGLVVLIVTPVAALILMATIIGIALALLVLGLYFIGLYISGIVASIIAGGFVLKNSNQYLQGFVGLLLLTIIGLIPIIGGLVKFIVLLVGMGVVFKKLRLLFQ
jgi:cytoskeletal protein CcmA (bactofilin family)